MRSSLLASGPAILLMTGLLTSAVSFAAASKPSNPRAAATPRPQRDYVLPDGSVRIVTFRGVDGVVRAINMVFTQRHPGTHFTVGDGDNYSAMACLTFNTSAVALVGSRFTVIGVGDARKIVPPPLGVRIAHASLAPGAELSPLAVIVNTANPLTSLNMGEVERIFAIGAPGGDVTQWSQIGVHGVLGSRDITPYGPPASDYTPFEDPQAGEYIGEKLDGLNLTHAYRQMASYREIVQRVAADPAAIGITALNQISGQVRVVGLIGPPGGKASSGSRDDIRAGRYPFDRFVYLYLRRDPQSRLDPFAVAYARAALSADGQHAIAAGRDGFIPLSTRELAQELSKLDR